MSGGGEVALVSVQIEAAVAVVTLENPPVNAMSDALLDGLGDALERLDGDDGVLAVVLTGSGEKAFAAGADLPALRHAMDSPGALSDHTDRTGRVLSRLNGMRAPTIAAIQASAVGGGLELALCADLAIVDARARLGLPEVGLGLIPGAGGTQRLARRIGVARATEMILRGRVIDSGSALELGLVSAVAEAGRTLSDALDLARELGRQPAIAVREALAAIKGGIALDLDSGLDLERAAFRRVLATEDAREGVDAFIDRRPPRFVNR
jgi:enoyl-CoA hydratase/carnithine racemase